MVQAIKNFYQSLIGVGFRLQSLILLGIRVYWGYLFYQAGWGKLGNIGGVADFFGSFGIPFPEFNAYLVGYVEAIGGLCLLFGVASRLAAIPLIVTMVVALLTAHWEAVAGVFQDHKEFVNQAPFNFLMASLIVFAFGPGKFAIDTLLEKLFKGGKKK
ncbi:MAG: DoxX family protein [Chlamydiia bacterium]|nr:DoxX family protein [Chlamydiia bacterium]